MSVTFDMYPQDTSWDISQDGSIISGSKEYPVDALEDAQVFCLPPGDYVFTIYDAYQDGM